MTVTNENRKISYVIDDTSEFTYAYTFDIVSPGEVFIAFFDTNGVEVVVVMVRTTSSSPAANEYYVDETNSNVVIGGAGTLQTQYETSITQLLITRVVDITQESMFPVATSLQSIAIETALDKNTMSTQQIDEILARCLRIPIQDDESQTVDLASAAVRADKFLAFDALGNPSVASSVTGSAIVSPVMEPVIAAATLAAARTILEVYSTSQVYTQTEADVITDALAVLIAANVTDTVFEIEHASNGTHNQTKVGFIDRGDPAAVDFAVGDLTTDGSWHDLDLSSIINNARAKAVAIHASIKDGTINQELVFRKKGNSNEINVSRIQTQVAAQSISVDMTVACNTSQVIEYKASNTTFTAINITVKGWYL